jgi:Holliday junction resolvase RusA-like endonuclease
MSDKAHPPTEEEAVDLGRPENFMEFCEQVSSPPFRFNEAQRAFFTRLHPDPITFVVYGHPMPKGSKTAVARGGRAYMIDAAPARSKDPEKRKAQRERMERWPIDVAMAAMHARWLDSFDPSAPREEDLCATIDGPVNVCARFFFPRPKSETRAQRLRIFHTGKPDLDKLLRGILDPMKKAGIFTDDCRVVSFNGSEKRYVEFPAAIGGALVFVDPRPRVEVMVTRLAETE